MSLSLFVLCVLICTVSSQTNEFCKPSQWGHQWALYSDITFRSSTCTAHSDFNGAAVITDQRWNDLNWPMIIEYKFKVNAVYNNNGRVGVTVYHHGDSDCDHYWIGLVIDGATARLTVNDTLGNAQWQEATPFSFVLGQEYSVSVIIDNDFATAVGKISLSVYRDGVIRGVVVDNESSVSRSGYVTSEKHVGIRNFEANVDATSLTISGYSGSVINGFLTKLISCQNVGLPPTPILTPLPTTDGPTLSPNTASPTTSQPTSRHPTTDPTTNPSSNPSNNPSAFPTDSPSSDPTKFPTDIPSLSPTKMPSKQPTSNPVTNAPSNNPTTTPSLFPTLPPVVITNNPTENPILSSTDSPSIQPTANPLTKSPSSFQSDQPTLFPIAMTLDPTTSLPTNNPLISTSDPSFYPSANPSMSPTLNLKSSENDSNNNNNNGVIDVIIVLVCAFLCFIAVYFCCRYRAYRNEQKGKEQDDYIKENLEMAHMNGGDGDGTQGHAIAVDEDEDDALREWLDGIDLMQYYDMFINHGFGGKMWTISKLTSEELEKMGVDKIGHQKAILESLVDMDEGHGANTTTKFEKQNTESLYFPIAPEETAGGTLKGPKLGIEDKRHTFVVEDDDEIGDKPTLLSDGESDEDVDDKLYAKGNGIDTNGYDV